MDFDVGSVHDDLLEEICEGLPVLGYSTNNDMMKLTRFKICEKRTLVRQLDEAAF